MLTLQINTRGAWHNVVEFEKSRRREVEAAALVLGLALGGRATFCVVDARGERTWLKPEGSA